MKRESLRNFFKAYRVGFDLWAIVLFAIIMLPNIIALCVPEFQAGLNADTGALEITATVFQVLFVVLLVFIERKGEQRLNFRSPLVSVCGLAVLAYYIAWIFFFCFFLNAAVYLSLAIFPSAGFSYSRSSVKIGLRSFLRRCLRSCISYRVVLHF